MAAGLFRAADIPRRLMPAAVMLGSSTFTMSALPGTPAIPNTIPMPFFGTTPFAAPGLGVVASAVMLAIGLWWLAPGGGRGAAAGEGFGTEQPDAADAAVDDPVVRERAVVAREFDPAEIHRAEEAPAPPDTLSSALPLVVVVLVNLLMSFVLLPRMDAKFLAEPRLGRDDALRRRWRLGCGHGARGGHPHTACGDRAANSLPAREHGCRRQCLRPAGVERGEPGGLRGGGRRACRPSPWCGNGCWVSEAGRWSPSRLPPTCWRP